MNRKAVAVLAIFMAAALAVAGAAFSRSSATPTLKGVVGPGFTISLKKGGKKVKTLKAGKYRIVVSDKSSFHNFTLEREAVEAEAREADHVDVGDHDEDHRLDAEAGKL